MPVAPKFVPVGPWLPDLPDYNNPGCLTAQNVFPRSSAAYGPIAAPTVYSGALGARAQGAAAFLDTSANVNIFAGTASDLFLLKAGSTDWTSVSKTSGAYACPPGYEWKFEYFNGNVVATDYADNIQVFNLASSSKFADLASAAPRAAFTAFIRGFLMVANTFDSTDSAQPQRVWWPSALDPTNWPTPGGVTAAGLQSSYNDLFGTNGAITGLVGNLGNADGAVFMQHGVFRVLYAGPPDVFDFLPAEGVRGCIAPNSIVPYANQAFYLGEDDFYVFDGAESQPIGVNQIAKTFFSDLDQANISRVVGAADPLNKQIVWAYPGGGSTNGTPNKLLIYNWAIQRWSEALITCETIARMLTIGYTLDELYTVLGYSLDTIPAPLDSPLWTGGSLLLGMFDTAHKLNFLTGQNLAPIVDMPEMQPYPGRRTKIIRARPMVDGGIPSMAIGKRETQQQSVVFTPSVAINALGACPIRTSGRYMRSRITLPAGSQFTNIFGAELETTQGGVR